MNNALNNVPADMIAIFAAEIANCKSMAAAAYDPITSYQARMKWRDLCDTLHSLGLSVAMFEV